MTKLPFNPEDLVRSCALCSLLVLVACAERADDSNAQQVDTTTSPQTSEVPNQELVVAEQREQSHALVATTDSGERPSDGRRIATSSWREHWKRGGQREDTVLRSPTFMATDTNAEMVYVLDRDPMAVAAFRLTDGSMAWHSDTMNVPSLGYLRDIAVRPNGEIVILQDPNTIHRVSRRGEWQPPLRLVDIQRPHTLCVPDDTSLLIYTLDERDPLVRVHTLGRVLERYPMPWDDLQGATAIETQSRLASGPDGACVVGLNLGRGFATIKGRSVGVRQPYVEDVKLPTVVRTTTEVNGQQARRERLPSNQPLAARSVAVRDSTILVLFAGLTPARNRVVDTYDFARGTYRESWRLPIPARAIAATPNLVLVLGTSAGYPTLLALTSP